MPDTHASIEVNRWIEAERRNAGGGLTAEPDAHMRAGTVQNRWQSLLRLCLPLLQELLGFG
jgi:hypothetical protein